MSRVEDELSTTTKAFESLFTIMGATVFNSLLRSATGTADNWSLKNYKTTAFLVYHYYAGLPNF